jgi:D-serine dehydratase
LAGGERLISDHRATLAPICDPLGDEPLDWTFKGLAARWEGLTSTEIGALESDLFGGQVMLPAAVLKRSVVDANRAWMRQFLDLTGAWLAPHGKTTLAPELFRLQAQDGAWAITAATAHHVRLYRRFGVSRIFLANQLVGEAEIDWILAEQARDPNFEFFCLVDSVAGVEHLAERLERHGDAAPLKVFLEVGRPGGRCGVRNVNEGLEVARAINARASQMTLVGIETFEGISQLGPDATASAEGMLSETVEIAKACLREHLFSGEILLLSGGGTGFFDLAARLLGSANLTAPVQVILRSGCYISHDDGAYGRLFEQLRQRMPQIDTFGPGLSGALEVWARVQSLPEPGQVICAFGRRDAGTDAGMPTPLFWVPKGQNRAQPAPGGLQVVSMFDQHAVLTSDMTHELRVGDILGFGISHPCTTFDKWRALLLVDDDYVIRDVIRTYF